MIKICKSEENNKIWIQEDKTKYCKINELLYKDKIQDQHSKNNEKSLSTITVNFRRTFRKCKICI